ncbi:MAG: type VI secretion system baseplate subunit TssK [Gemmataceae bacterium]
MAIRPVHWEEGMFLGPQHLQAAGRFEANRRHLLARAATRYNWGIVSLELNKDALKNHRIEVLSLRAILRDGTFVDLPNDGPIPAADFRAGLEQASPLRAWLAVPTMQPGRANATDVPADRRFVLETQSTEDENAQGEPQPIRFRLFNSRFFMTNEREQGGFDVLSIAQVKRGSDANSTPEIDTKYIPPLLSCDAWEPLQVLVLRAIFDRMGGKISLLADQVQTRGISIESSHPEDARIVAQLKLLNEAYTVLNVIGFVEGVHPVDAYRELCRVVGQLCVYGDTPRPPAIPPYDHDNLGPVFWELKRLIDLLLDKIQEPDYASQPFKVVMKDKRPHLQVDLKPVWLEPGWQMYVGVKSTFPANHCVPLITQANYLDMKIASSDRVDDLFQGGFKGLEFRHTVKAPHALPNAANLIYFEINPLVRPELWDAVRRTYSLALRLNPNNLENPVAGKQQVTIKSPAGPKEMDLTLYVVRPR